MTIISDEKIIIGGWYEIKVLDIESGVCLRTLKVDNDYYIKSLTKISNDRIASGDHSGKIIIWNINNGEILKTIEVHSNIIHSIARLSSNKIISSCPIDSSIKVWDIETGVCLETFEDTTIILSI